MNAKVELGERYERDAGRVLLSGTQALVRLPLLQRARDAAAGLNTAGFISGYRGSPLAGYDLQLGRERERLAAAGIRFQPGVNEDLAATAIWGTQQAALLPGATVAGVFAIWYGKGPGVDRSGDPFKHGNRMGSAKHGGVLVAYGDDHGGKSSTVAYQSEQALAAAGIPSFYPATVQDYLHLGLHAFALSRCAGVWVGFKCVNETIETTATVDLDAVAPAIVQPEGVPLPADGVHARIAFEPLADDVRLQRYKLPLAQAYVRANRLDHVTHGDGAGAARNLGIVTAGKSWLDVAQALASLGLDEPRLAQLGVSVRKIAMIWPLEPQGLVEYARGRRELLFVEEKAALLEPQAAHALYNLDAATRPRIAGKRTPEGEPLFPSDVPLEPVDIALTIATRLRALGLADAALEARVRLLERGVVDARARRGGATVRTPYFCSGCPHNTSTKVPDGSIAMAGIGCHTLALMMDRRTLPPTQMGGEGVNWSGIAPFSSLPHVFQNLGDGTYFHSGLLAVRAAVTAGVNITYKLLVNDAVAMTGGQAVEGQLTVAELTHQLRGERVQRIAVVSDDIDKYGVSPGFAPGTSVHHRRELDAVQRELRTLPGVSAILYDQTCATEKRRRRKRGTLADPDVRVLINELVCEGCGDCSVQANCVSIEPAETEFGRKRRIDQAGCNKDLSCVEGFCPSFVTVRGVRPRRAARPALDGALSQPLPEPARAPLAPRATVLVTGIGGTGVVTVGAVLAMAAHLDGYATSVYDMTGLAQKGGAVLSHLRIAREPGELGTPRVGLLEADVVIGCDLVVSASAEVLRALRHGETHVVLNSELVPTAALQSNPDVDFKPAELAAAVQATAGPAQVALVAATAAARALLGDTLATNVFMVGYALQKGWLPVSLASVERAIELNGTAVSFNRTALALGRLAAHDAARYAQLLAGASQTAGAGGAAAGANAGTGGGAVNGTARDLAATLAAREPFLRDYQDAAYAARYRALVERVSAAERAIAPGSEALALAVARSYFRLLAYKDEYEVARLYSGEAFRAQLANAFEGEPRLTFHLAPPLLARRDPVTGRARKRAYGSWMAGAFRVLAKLRGLRGTPFDPFGWSADRRLERALIGEYEALVEELLAGLAPARYTPERLALATEIASVPEKMRGYGHVKDASVAAARARLAELLARWRQASGAGAQASAAAA